MKFGKIAKTVLTGGIAPVLGNKRVSGALFGSKSGVALPGEYKPTDTEATMRRYMSEGGLMEKSGGMKSMEEALSMARAGLGGYTGEQEQAMFAREADRIRAQQNLAQREAMRGATMAGLSGGMAARLAGRLQQQAQEQQASMARDLSLQNIAEQQRRLGQYAELAGGLNAAEMQRRLAGASMAQQAEANKMAAYQTALQRYGLSPEQKSGGLFGAISEKLLPGLGGNIYSALRWG